MDYVLYFLLIFACGLFIFNLLNVITYYLQLNEYNQLHNVRTVLSKLSVEIVAIYMSPAILSGVLNLILYKSKVLTIFVLVEVLSFLVLVFVLGIAKTVRKVHLKITRRYARIYIVSLILSVLSVSYACYVLMFSYKYLFPLVYLTPIVVFACVVLGGVITYPVELIVRAYYMHKACKMLKLHGGIINIAITGSFGKTSTKFMLKTILSQKYNVLATPLSYNTPMGVAKCINELLSPTHDVFIMEFGAKRKGDIKYLCHKFKPNIGIITGIGKAHISTFGSIDNVIKAKSELVGNLYGNSPYAVFGTDSKYASKCQSNCRCEKISCGINSGQLIAKNISMSANGCKFDIFLKNKYYLTANTKLIGNHNISNILLCVAVAIRLKLSKQQIINGIAQIKPIRARMEVMPHSSGALIINDGYNSNPTSARIAVDTMDMFGKKNKLVLTPGMVELGRDQAKENYEFAKYMAGRVDKVYIANQVNQSNLYKGLIDGGMNMQNITKNSELNSVLKKLTKDDILLIENDLPDNYN